MSSSVRDFEINDTMLILGALLAIYVLYLVGGTLLGYSLRGQLNSLARLTFLIGVYGMLALALNLHWGYTGLFNIGIAGFMAVGLYTMAMISKPPASASAGAATVSGLGLPLWVGILGGMLAAAILGLLVALPALRLRADYLAIVTIATSEIIRFIVTSNQFQTFTIPGKLHYLGITIPLPWNAVQLGTGGGRGLLLNFTDPLDPLFNSGPYKAIEHALDPLVGGSSGPVLDSLTYAIILLLFVVAYYWLMKRTGESPFGRVLKAIREDEQVANSLGKDTNQFKIKSFMLGCALMGLAGILWQMRQGAITPTSFKPQVTFFVWLALIIGGAGSNTGSVLGAAIFAGLLYQGPLYLKNIIRGSIQVPTAPNSFAGAVGPIFHGNIMPFISYMMGNINALQLVLMGCVLIWIMHHRPEGVLGHRKEEAASIPLLRPGGGSGGPKPDAATDGGEEQ
ncbi:branched-chain amino acid ABC transporter permease [Haladaptatus sp. R4]|uniref:branched-chain amino acid ABC transporter permease n=1 Tax=Haladaptatus sp. R4 TaxID=1679489 RepID=UPI0007B4F5B8|nr:branched-chain amino acid ABC transporter permease [Haladaptatus sp. R4]KZN23620.1 branched-chain amino acid ABC transporter permease [Haladaptatus sp. R4]